jgi:hypothetical protein
MISLFSSEPLRRARSKRLWTELWAGIGKAVAGETRDKDRKVKKQLRTLDGSLGPEVKYKVLMIGKAPKEKDRHYIEFLGGCSPLNEERSYTLTFVRRCVCTVCLSRCDWDGGGPVSAYSHHRLELTKRI